MLQAPGDTWPPGLGRPPCLSPFDVRCFSSWSEPVFSSCSTQAPYMPSRAWKLLSWHAGLHPFMNSGHCVTHMGVTEKGTSLSKCVIPMPSGTTMVLISLF